TFPLWYAQGVEGIRRDVIVIVYSYLGTEWYPRQLRDLSRPCDGRDPLADPRVIVCQRPFEPETAVSAYRGGTWSPPTRAILGWNDDEIRGLFDSALPRGAWRFVAGEIDTVIPAEVRLLPNDLFILGIIQHSIGDRPIYFASTTDAFRPLQLDRYLVRQGLAYRVNNGPIDRSRFCGSSSSTASFSRSRSGPTIRPKGFRRSITARTSTSQLPTRSWRTSQSSCRTCGAAKSFWHSPSVGKRHPRYRWSPSRAPQEPRPPRDCARNRRA
ncbi:MAG: hypothetical protein HYY94_02355, partial [Gemmatimonadetes bacterium]|nr:hypothetical protein [Gemmatimonadota bacterium]